MISIINNSKLIYPKSLDDFSPNIQYPEYPFESISNTNNEVYDAVRNIFLQMGMDVSNAGLKIWNPLKDYVKPNDRVFLLCNFVFHKRKKENEDTLFSKVTHPSVIRAICDYCIIALKGRGEIHIGNSPLQIANFERIKQTFGLNKIEDFYSTNHSSVKVKFIDLRGYITKQSRSGKLTVVKNEIEKVGINVDFSEYSLFNELKGNRKYRVTNYSYKWITKLHNNRKHIYCINKEILNSDVIISIPKLKVHEKVGITLGVKGYVGAMASKESLCHHQFGPPCIGGDEYPVCNPFKILYSHLHDFAYSYKIPIITSFFQILDRNLSRIASRIGTKIIGGAWFGNDTAWRMAVDLAKIMHFVDNHGKVNDKVIRKNLILVDGVIGGEGQGPLNPKPIISNTLVFSDNVVDGDYVGAIIMGFEPEKFKIVEDFYKKGRKLKIVSEKPEECIYNGKIIQTIVLKEKFHYSFLLPKGWRTYINSPVSFPKNPNKSILTKKA